MEDEVEFERYAERLLQGISKETRRTGEYHDIDRQYVKIMKGIRRGYAMGDAELH